MTLSRQEETSAKSGRQNQKARTRSAVLAAAVDLVREGRAPSIPEAAERALVSVATAYRYFATAEDLWEEASIEAVEFIEVGAEVARAVDAAGDDPMRRLDAVMDSLGSRMLDDELPYRRMAKAGLERWFAQRSELPADRMPVRQGRRHRWSLAIVSPLRGELTPREFEQLVAALDVAWGTEAVIALRDVAGLDVETAKATMRKTCQWLIQGAMSDAKARRRQKVQADRNRVAEAR